MEGLQQQIQALEQKIDRVYDVVEQLRAQVTEVLASEVQSCSQSVADDEDLTQLVGDPPRPTPAARHLSPSDRCFEHKDVLLDDDDISLTSTTSSGQPVSSEIQIRRLNTQLTAAYNRIAALEEQLLAHRIHF